MPTVIHDDLAAQMLSWSILGVGSNVNAKWVGLLDTGGTEVTGGGYARINSSQLVTAAPGACAWTSALVFTVPTVTVRSAAFYTASSGGSPMVTIPLDSDAVCTAGDTVTLTSATLTLALGAGFTTDTLGGEQLMTVLRVAGTLTSNDRWFFLADAGAIFTPEGFAELENPAWITDPVDENLVNDALYRFVGWGAENIDTWVLRDHGANVWFDGSLASAVAMDAGNDGDFAIGDFAITLVGS